MNDRGVSKGAMFARAATVREVFDTTLLLARAHRLPTGVPFATVTLHYHPNSNARRDSDNLVATLKPICDALSRGTRAHPGHGLTADDDATRMAKPEPVIYRHNPDHPPGMWLEIELDDKPRHQQLPKELACIT